ncbi:MAG: hypothetical protein RIQ71_1446, partial [Verrucomicrobiota bacterium]
MNNKKLTFGAIALVLLAILIATAALVEPQTET